MNIKYCSHDILIFVDENYDIWYRGRDVGNVLKYDKPRNVIGTRVALGDKICYKSISKYASDTVCAKIDPRTLFINHSGLKQFVAFSRKNGSVVFAQTIGLNVVYKKPIMNYILQTN
jgi:prophage antirepressor-like protein